MIRKGDEIRNKNGVVIFIAAEDVFVGKPMTGREFMRPGGTYPDIGSAMDEDFIAEMDRRGLAPNHWPMML